MWTYQAKLIRVVDGDTAILAVDVGFHTISRQSIRLLGVDAPELFSGTDRTYAQFVKMQVVDWFAIHNHDSAEWPLSLETQKDKQTFNRYIGRISCLHGHSLNAFVDTLVKGRVAGEERHHGQGV